MPPELADTHCHLTSDQLYLQADRVISDAAAERVTRLITVACSRGDAERALELWRRHASVWIAAGVHPHEAGQAGPAEFQRLAAVWREPGVIAAGEMGLDYHYDFSTPDAQREAFRRQLELVAATGLPLIIHCRQAQPDVIRILCEYGFDGRKVVFHCFSGTPDEAAELRAHGWRTSYTGIITFKKSAPQQEAFAQTPLEEVMFETDAPYLSPEPVRKMRTNEPKNLVHTVRFGAMLRGISFEQLATASTQNAVSFFGLE